MPHTSSAFSLWLVKLDAIIDPYLDRVQTQKKQGIGKQDSVDRESIYDVEDSIFPLQPSINYTAPEMPLFDCHNNVKMYMNTLTYLSSDAFSSIPSELVPDLHRMLSLNESFRPTAMDFTGSQFFRNDTRLRALRFLDHMLERDNMQKSEFLKALSDMWKDFDYRVL
ncbi:hypothetical protein KIW84_074925 [Lathyrus oleraceus]|uniref:Uncharacterized protein n=1 Tax=Pisum sativum TaxID=3888 RepID=A0A9D4ZXG8_PEA|nr:hypothetical protein KIW84_074925 [Pisum sativum]